MTVDLPERDGFGIENLPFAVARLPGGAAVCASRIGDQVVDLDALARAGGFDGLDLPDGVFATETLNRFLALGREAWSGVRTRLAALLASGDHRVRGTLVPLDAVELMMPVAVGDYVDFSASLHHAVNIGRRLRPGREAVAANWRCLPRGYHGTASTLCVSGTPVERPRVPGPDGRLSPTHALDFEAEVAFVVGAGNRPGYRIPTSAMRDHVVGLLLLNDWSARDVQAIESEPLGPFLAKSFATSVSPWLVTLDALDPYRVAASEQDPPPAPYLRVDGDWAYDVELAVSIDGATRSTPRFADLYWTIPQLLAHATANGAATRTGDLFGCGTTSGPHPGTEGSLFETGAPLLDDGQRVVIGGWAGNDGSATAPLSLGHVAGTVLPARPMEA